MLSELTDILADLFARYGLTKEVIKLSQVIIYSPISLFMSSSITSDNLITSFVGPYNKNKSASISVSSLNIFIPPSYFLLSSF